MAGIFSIFSEENNSSIYSYNGKEKSHNSISAAKSKSIGGIGLPPIKSFSQLQIKPKGLSIRSKSDLNVPISSNFKSNILNSKDCLKLDDQCTSAKQSVSPIKLKTPKSKSCVNAASKKLSPKISSPIMQNVEDDFVFIKPATPRESKKLKVYPEPEKLAYCYDPCNYMNEEVESIFNEDRKWLKRAMHSSVNQLNDSGASLEDEGFISDPERDSFEIQISSPLPSFNLSEVDLPDISDCED